MPALSEETTALALQARLADGALAGIWAREART